MAHRDDTRRRAGRERQRLGHRGADRARARVRARRAGRPAVQPAHTLVFLSTDGGSTAARGATACESIAHARADRRRRQPRLDRRRRAGRPQSPPTTPAVARRGLVETAAARIAAETGGSRAGRPGARASSSTSASRSASTSRRRSSPRGIPAVTITTAGDRPPRGLRRHARRGSTATRLGQIGRATQSAARRARPGRRAAPGAVELRLSRQRHRARLGDRVRARRDAAALPRRDRRPLRPLPPAADPPSRRPLRSYREPARLLALVRRAVRALRAARRLAGRRRRGRPPLADRVALAALGGSLVLVVLAGARLARRARPALAAAARRAGGGARRATPRRCSRLGVVALLVVATNPFALIFLLPSLHVWLWLPQLRDESGLGPARSCSPPGFSGPSSSLGSFAVPLRARPGCTLVPCGALRARLRPAPGFVIALAWPAGRRAAARARRRPLRAVSDRRRAAAARADPRDVRRLVLALRGRRAPRRTGKRWRLRCGAPRGSPARPDDRRGRLLTCLGAGRLAVAGPVHRALHEVRAAQARVAARPAASPTYQPRRRENSRARRGVGGKLAIEARALPPRSRRGARGRPHRRAAPRAEVDRRQRHRSRRPDEGPGPRAAHVHAGPRRARLRRRPPDDLPRALRPHRQPEAGRPRSPSSCRTRRSSTRSPATRSSPPTTSPFSSRTHEELLVLQACHPRFFATHRYLAYAKLVRVEPRDGAAYDVGADRPDSAS